MTVDTTATVITAAVTVLGGLATAVRMLVRILAQIERVTTIAEHVARQLATHIEHHDAADAAVIERLHDHGTAIAVLQAKTTTSAAGSVGPAT